MIIDSINKVMKVKYTCEECSAQSKKDFYLDKLESGEDLILYCKNCGNERKLNEEEEDTLFYILRRG